MPAWERALVESPSARPWLGAGAALSALPAAGGCFCAALLLAAFTGSDVDAAYEQHRWLGAMVAASAVCAFAAMMGWATLRHGGLPLPVLLVALVLAGVPFLLPRGVFLPAAALAIAGCAAAATAGLAHPPAVAGGTRLAVGALAGAAVILAIGQALAIPFTDGPRPRARVLADRPAVAHSPQRAHHARARHPSPAPSGEAKAKPGGRDAVPASAVARKPSPASTPAPAAARKPTQPPAPAASPSPAVPPPASASPPPPAAARRFVRTYYAALNRHRFAVAWRMLSPDVQRAFGGFAGWRRGYARTVFHSPGGVRVAGSTVALTLRAGDRGACGTVAERRFAVTWRLARTAAGWRATAASARKLSGPEPC
jgi:hypothetical protein